MTKSPNFEIITGSYEEFLVGYNFIKKQDNLSQSFAAHDHTGSIRCVAHSDHYLASGGTDDRIFIYDLKSRKEHCSLTHHNASITCLQFTNNHTHLISGSSDGVLAIVRVGNWQLEKIWNKAHKGAAVLDIAVHSSGKMALSLGADASLCTWNLVKGRQAYVINLKSKSKDPSSLEKILWAPDELRFLLYGGKYTEIWSIDTGGILKQIKHPQKVTTCIWLSDESILVGYEDGQIATINTNDLRQTMYTAHNIRVKALSKFKNWIVSISSNGEIKVWNDEFEEVAMCETGCRLMCLCVVPIDKIKKEKSSENVVNVEENNETLMEVSEDNTRQSKGKNKRKCLKVTIEETEEITKNKKRVEEIEECDVKKNKKFGAKNKKDKR